MLADRAAAAGGTGLTAQGAPAPFGRWAPSPTLLVLLAVIVGAWALSGWAELSGAATRFHHDALYRSGLPLWQAALLILAAWQVMTSAMMLPSSLSMIRLYAAAAGAGAHGAVTLFLLAYFAVWSVFAVFAFAGDMALHRSVDTSPWLYEHARLIPVATLALAGAYQLTPLKEACLRQCRHPGAFLLRYYRRGALEGFRLGLRHAMFCIGCCWALMLVMFAAGVAHLAWMGLLAVIMVVEKAVPGGRRLTLPVGLGFLGAAAVLLLAPSAVGL